MKLSQLKYFKTVAELGKIALAAESLYISPPALSASIASLEKELGVPLFDRTSNRIVLNEEGKIFLRYVNQIFNSIECAKLEIQQSVENSARSVHIAVTTSSIWTPMISAFSQEYPHIMLSCTTLKISQLDNVNLSRLHTFILAERDDFYSADMASIPLFEEHPWAIVPVDHPLADRELIELEDLVNEILFLPMADQSLNKRIKELFFSKKLSPKRIHEYADGICKSMVAEGRGISFTTKYPSKPQTNTQRYIPINAPDCHWEQHIYWNKDRVFTDAEELLKQFILDMYQN